jgi:hypothetical protein
LAVSLRPIVIDKISFYRGDGIFGVDGANRTAICALSPCGAEEAMRPSFERSVRTSCSLNSFSESIRPVEEGADGRGPIADWAVRMLGSRLDNGEFDFSEIMVEPMRLSNCVSKELTVLFGVNRNKFSVLEIHDS